MHMIHSLQQALGGISPQAMFQYVAVLGKKIAGKTNQSLQGSMLSYFC